jgi:hypothetical protein
VENVSLEELGRMKKNLRAVLSGLVNASHEIPSLKDCVGETKSLEAWCDQWLKKLDRSKVEDRDFVTGSNSFWECFNKLRIPNALDMSMSEYPNLAAELEKLKRRIEEIYKERGIMRHKISFHDAMKQQSVKTEKAD